MVQQSMKRDGGHSLNKMLPEAARISNTQELHSDSGALPSAAPRFTNSEAQLPKSRANVNGGNAGVLAAAVEKENAEKRSHQKAWLPEETQPAPLRADGGAASPPPASLDEALRPLLPESADQALTGFKKVNAVLNNQLSLLSNTAKEVRAQYDRVRWREVQRVDPQRLAQRLFNKQAREVVRLGERWKHVDLSGSHEVSGANRAPASGKDSGEAGCEASICNM